MAKWMQKAAADMEKEGTKGDFTAKAKAAGMAVQAFARKVTTAYSKWVKSGRTGAPPYDLKTYRQAQFALRAGGAKKD